MNRPHPTARDPAPRSYRAAAWWLLGATLLACSLTGFGASLHAANPAGTGDSGDPDAEPTLESLGESMVELAARIPGEARTARILGVRRQGHGIVIDSDGLVLTIGYLVLEAEEVLLRTHDGRIVPAQVVGYDTRSGLGLVRAQAPLGVPSIRLGSAIGLNELDPVLVLSRNAQVVRTAVVTSRRAFAGYWEYLVEDAIYTAPALTDYAGSALVDQHFRLVGVGSLYVEDAAGGEAALPGNLFIPVDTLTQVLPELLRTGRPSGAPRPWLGINVIEQFDRVLVTRTTKGGPAEKAGLQQGDIILAVNGTEVGSLEQFYRTLWGQGPAGATVELRLLQGHTLTQRPIVTEDRYRHYQLPGKR